MTKPLSIASLIFLIVVSATGCAGLGAGLERTPQLQHIQTSEATSTSMATVVGDVALAHTDQFYAQNQRGDLVGAGDLEAQVRQVLENVGTALRLVGSDLTDVAKLNVYMAESVSAEEIKRLLPSVLPEGSRPAVTFVSIEVPHSDALVAMDAVAVAPSTNRSDVAFHRSDALHAGPGDAHVAVLPAGPKVYVSGQAKRGELLEGVSETMVGLHATLAYVGLSANDVVQVKAFVNTMSEARAIEETIGEYYRNRPAPPIVVTEWRQDGSPAEIELIASGRDDAYRSDEAITYVTPAGMSSSPVFSRLAEVNHGGLVFVSGLYGRPGQDDEAQVRAIFDELEDVLGEAGSDFEHMAKATYYPTTREASDALNDVRPELYNPQRPPAASKIQVRSLGREDATVTVDMIAVVPN